MLTYRCSRRVAWGQCDPGGIIFAPVYAQWMAEGVTELFLSIGVDPHRLIEGGKRCGLPVLQQELRYHLPALLHDRVEHVIRVAKVGTKSLVFEHQMLRAETCLMDATETRVWGVHPLAHPERLEALPVPDDVRRLLAQSSGGTL